MKMNPAVKAYILHGSPLKTARGRTILIVILAIVFACAVAGRFSIGAPTLMKTYAWMGYSIVGSLAAYFIVGFLDRKRSVKWFHLLVVLTVALQSAFCAAFFNDISPIKLYTVGFVEEFFKILPVLLLAIFTPNIIRTRKDGMLYGALAGIGFNIVEIGLYITRGIEGGSTYMEAVWTHSTRLALLGFGNHIIWSAFVGLGLGISVESAGKGLRKWMPFILLYVIVAMVHSIFDLILAGVFMVISLFLLTVLSGMGMQDLTFEPADMGKPGIVHNSMVLEHFVYNIVFIVIIVMQMLRSANREQGIYAAELADEGGDVITAGEKKLLAEEGSWGMRRYHEFPGRVSKRIVKLQNMLAMLKYSIKKEGESAADSPDVAVMRRAIADLRAANS